MSSKSVSSARKIFPLGAAMVSILAGACSEPTAPERPTAPVAVAAAAQAPTGRGIDAEFTRLSKQIPGFGGMYYDAAGKLNVYVTKPKVGAATARSADVMSSLRALGGPTIQGRMNKASLVVTKEGKYDYGQLQAWKGKLTRIFAVKGVVYTDIDESENRLRVAVTPSASQAAVQQALTKAGVPKEAVLISRMPAINRVKTLQDKIRPVPGGAQITFFAPSLDPDPNALFVCSIGFNAQIPGNAGNFFVTASHCSDIQGGNQHTKYYQELPVAGHPNTNKIAQEFKDPRYGNPGGLCVYEGFRCRLSDALLARYGGSIPVDLGGIARTTFGLQRIGSLIIDKKNPRWNIVGEFSFPFEGEIANKVGRTTGWTSGPVIATCVDVGVNGTDIVQLCQDIALAGVGGGDSGSPIFERADDVSSDVFLTGVLWGSGTLDGAPIFIMSAMENIEFELGPLFTSGAPLVASSAQ